MYQEKDYLKMEAMEVDTAVPSGKSEFELIYNRLYQSIIDNLLESEYPSTIKIFKETDDDWFGNWPGNLIEVSCSLNSPTLNERKFQRVGCWGNDNYGLIKDFDNKEDALNTFRQIITWSKVNQEDLFRIGFKEF